MAENQTAVTTFSVSDVDEDDLTLTLAGTDADSFNLSSKNVLTFKEAPDYETKTSYSITLTLTDGFETVTKDITINVTNVNDVAPVFIGGSSYSTEENKKFITIINVYDSEGDSLSFSISGNDAENFNIDSSSGALSFKDTPDYETKNKYILTIIANDGVNSTSLKMTINIINIEENSFGDCRFGSCKFGS